MFSIGLPEIAIIFLVLILFIKPEDIPKVFQSLGRWYSNLQRLYLGVTDEFRELSYDLENLNTNSSENVTKQKKEPAKNTNRIQKNKCKPVSFQDNSNINNSAAL